MKHALQNTQISIENVIMYCKKFNSLNIQKVSRVVLQNTSLGKEFSNGILPIRSYSEHPTL